MRCPLFLFTFILFLGLFQGCSEKGGLTTPPEVGRSLSEPDSLRAVLSWLEQQRGHGADTLRLWTYCEQIKVTGSQSPDSALSYYARLCSLRKAFGDNRSLASCYNSLGLLYQTQGQYAEALKSYREAFQIGEALQDTQAMATASNGLGRVHYVQGQYARALEWFEKTARLMEALGEKRELAVVYNNMGLIHETQGRYAQALKYLQKAHQLWEALGNKEKVSASCTEIGMLFMLQWKYPEALAYYQKALQIHEAMGHQEGIATACQNIGSLYEAWGQGAEALKYYLRAAQIQEALGHQEGLGFSYTSLGGLYFRLRQPQKARACLLKALDIASRLRACERLREIYLLLARTDSMLAASGQPAFWKTAYEYAWLHGIYTDSVLNAQSIRWQARLDSQYEYEKRVALQKVEAQSQQVLTQAELDHAQTQRLLFGLVVVGMGIMGGIAYSLFLLLRRRNRQLAKANAALKTSTRHIRTQKQELKARAAELAASRARLEAINSAIAESGKVIQAQAEALAEKNAAILENLRYAQHLQRATLPSADRWEKLIPASFVLYLPRTAVGGDFYWVEENGQYVFVAVVDVRGQGAAGAFLSFACASALSKAVLEEGLESPARILEWVGQLLQNQLTREDGQMREEMEIALLRLEKANPRRLVFCGAGRPLWVITGQGELIEIKGLRQAVRYGGEKRPYEQVEVSLEGRVPAMLYAFTDGLTNQVGGEHGHKLAVRGLREVILSLYWEPVAVQAARLETFLERWRGNHQQVDDIICVGIRVK